VAPTGLHAINLQGGRVHVCGTVWDAALGVPGWAAGRRSVVRCSAEQNELEFGRTACLLCQGRRTSCTPAHCVALVARCRARRGAGQSHLMARCHLGWITH
jgi:hypothetical protein